jgi:pyridoxamine 5'-phosphate oxidase
MTDNNLGLPADPLDGLVSWLEDAAASGQPEPTAMTLATASKVGKPSARIVLFKGLSSAPDGRRCPRFFTNYDSRKSKEMGENPFAALVFHWHEPVRQLRVEGRLEKTSKKESEEYFFSRPRGSQIGAWASPQSRKISGRAELDSLVEEIEKKFAVGPIPCPENWGGWRVIPERIEFWQSVPDRLHDRFVYEWNGRGWDFSRLAP